jgi:hypothetical protein
MPAGVREPEAVMDTPPRHEAWPARRPRACHSRAHCLQVEEAGGTLIWGLLSSVLVALILVVMLAGLATPAEGDSFVVFNSGQSSFRPFGTVEDLSAKLASPATLFHFKFKYVVYAGTCEADLPTVNGWPGPNPEVELGAGTTTPISVPVAPVKIRVMNGRSVAEPGEVIEGAGGYTKDLGCGSERSFVTNSEGALPRPGLPADSYLLCAGSAGSAASFWRAPFGSASAGADRSASVDLAAGAGLAPLALDVPALGEAAHGERHEQHLGGDDQERQDSEQPGVEARLGEACFVAVEPARRCDEREDAQQDRECRRDREHPAVPAGGEEGERQIDHDEADLDWERSLEHAPAAHGDDEHERCAHEQQQDHGRACGLHDGLVAIGVRDDHAGLALPAGGGGHTSMTIQSLAGCVGDSGER